LKLEEKLVSEGYESVFVLSIALAQAKIGDSQGSLQTSVRTPDLLFRQVVQVGGDIRFREGIAQIMARRGDLSSAFTTIEDAIATTKVLKESFRDINFARIAIAQAQIGDFQGALKTASSIREDSLKERALSEIAISTAERGNWKMAASLLPKINNPTFKWGVLPAIAIGQAKDGVRAASKETLKQALQIAIRLMKESATSGDVNRMKDALALSAAIAVAEARIGTTRQALQIAATYTKNLPSLLFDIAKARANLGDAEGALQAVELIQPTAREKRIAVWTIAYQLAQFGDESPILSWIDKQQSPFYKAIALIGLLKGRKVIRDTVEAVPIK
jgi:hypothetical protein